MDTLTKILRTIKSQIFPRKFGTILYPNGKQHKIKCDKCRLNATTVKIKTTTDIWGNGETTQKENYYCEFHRP